MKARGCQDEVGEAEQPCHHTPCISHSELELDPNLRRSQCKQGSYMIQLISESSFWDVVWNRAKVARMEQIAIVLEGW